jgi:hypothetical protein
MATLAPEKPVTPTVEQDIHELRRRFQDGWVPAREYFREVHARHGDAPELAYWKGILMPAKPIVRPSTKPYRSDRLDFDWIKANAGAYYGQWLALDQGVLLAHGSDANEVAAAAREKAPEADFMLFHAVGYPR